jgi:rod shape-determining protein MreB
MTFDRAFGVDLGTGSVRIYDQKNDRILKEFNVAALRNGNTVISVGNDAYALTGRTPLNIEIIHPMARGHIQNARMMEAVLHTLLGRCGGFAGLRPAVFFSVPVNITAIEKSTYTTVTKKGRFRNASVFLVEKPVADALALGIPVLNTDGAVLINIGEQSTEVAVIADRRVIITQTIPVGGMHFTAEIKDSIRRRNSFIVSENTARRLKMTLCRLDRDPGDGCKVGGIDLDSGLPRNGIVSSASVISSVKRMLESICGDILKLMERFPPHIQEIAVKDGIYVTGGSARIPGLSDYLSLQLGCPVSIPGLYELSTVNGLKAVMTHRELTHWAVPSGRPLE